MHATTHDDNVLGLAGSLKPKGEYPLVAPPSANALPILDLYVGSLNEPDGTFAYKYPLEWVCLGKGRSDQLLRKSTEGAFLMGETVDQLAYQRVITGFFGHCESLAEHSWLALVHNRPAGAVLVSLRDYYSAEREYPYIDLVAVDPKFQRNGLGAALLRQSLGSLAAAGYRSIVHAHIRRGNLASERLFLNQGFLLWRRDDC